MAPEGLFTKTQLRERRLKPASGQQPASRYWQGHGWVYVYDPAQAVPMRAYRAPSPAQAAALAIGRQLAGTAVCPSCEARISKKELEQPGMCRTCLDAMHRQEPLDEWRACCRYAANLLAGGCVFVDTETTGLDNDAEIIEIAAVDGAGSVLLDTLVQPLSEISAGATAVHGLTRAELVDAPAWPDVVAQVDAALQGRIVVAHNADFEARMLRQTSARHGVIVPTAARWECTLELLTSANGGRWPPLGAAMRLAGAAAVDQAHHRARHDAERCRRIVVAMAEQACGS